MSLARALDHNYGRQTDCLQEVATRVRDDCIGELSESELPPNVTRETSTRYISYFHVVFYVIILCISSVQLCPCGSVGLLSLW